MRQEGVDGLVDYFGTVSISSQETTKVGSLKDLVEHHRPQNMEVLLPEGREKEKGVW